MNKIDLKVDTIYPLDKDLNGLKVCILKSNRNNADKNKKMMQGCQDTEMQQPGIVTEASLAFEVGYTLLDVETGVEINDSNVKDYLVILDGNTRFHAWQMALKTSNPFTYIFQYKKYGDAATFKKAYQNINVYNTPTSTADFMRDFAVSSDNKVLSSYNQKIRDKLCPKAAGYATIGREIMKADIVSLGRGSGPSYFSDYKTLEVYSKLYEGLDLLRKECPSIFKGTEIWKYFATHIKNASDQSKEADRMLKLITTLPPTSFSKLLKAKKDGTKPKETVVSEILDEALKQLA